MASEELKQTKERERKERKRRPSPSSTLSLSLVRFKSRRESIRVGFDRSSHRGGEKSRGAGPLVVASRVEEVEERRRRRKQQRERERERESLFFPFLSSSSSSSSAKVFFHLHFRFFSFPSFPQFARPSPSRSSIPVSRVRGNRDL